MAIISHIKNINEFITAFLTEHGSEDMVNQWNQEENMEAFTKLIAKASKKPKKTKDPKKPKRSKSAYIFFCAANRDAAKAELGKDAKWATDVTSKLGEMWRTLKESKKETDKKALAGFEKEAKADKERYDQEMMGYEPPSEEELVKGAKKKRKTKKDPKAPKRSKSAYIFFCADKRTEVKVELGNDAKNTEITARLGKLWNELKSDEDREDEMKVYTDQAAEDKVRYEAEIAEYRAMATETNDVTETKKSVPVPKKGNKAGYNYFCNEHRADVKAENPNMKAVDVTKTLREMWMTLDKSEVENWNNAAAELE
jgi:hypothetical protein